MWFFCLSFSPSLQRIHQEAWLLFLCLFQQLGATWARKEIETFGEFLPSFFKESFFRELPNVIWDVKGNLLTLQHNRNSTAIKTHHYLSLPLSHLRFSFFFFFFDRLCDTNVYTEQCQQLRSIVVARVVDCIGFSREFRTFLNVKIPLAWSKRASRTRSRPPPIPVRQTDPPIAHGFKPLLTSIDYSRAVCYNWSIDWLISLCYSPVYRPQDRPVTSRII